MAHKTFSQRKGLTPLEKSLQIDSIDSDLKNGLWNVLYSCYLNEANVHHAVDADKVKKRALIMWVNFFKKPINKLNDQRMSVCVEVIETLYYKLSWNEIYDFIEHLAQSIDPIGWSKQDFIDMCNKKLENESSAYRFVGNIIAENISSAEIQEIEDALSSPLRPVQIQIENALTHLSNRKKPDYRNSIKESIGAVETICKKITGNNNSTLGDALSEIRKTGKVQLHPALNSAFDKMYGYTSSADGIRHALLDETDLNYDDAKFMLVSCSAFVNYLVAKASKSGISLK